MPHVIVLKDHPHYLTKYEGKETKISIFKIFNELAKIWKCNLSFSKIPIPHLFMNWEKLGNIATAPDQHFKIQMLNLWMSWENLCPNLSFFLENKKGNSQKRRWSHFKLNLNDGDIPFPKFLEFINELGKLFSIGENVMNPLSW